MLENSNFNICIKDATMTTQPTVISTDIHLSTNRKIFCCASPLVWIRDSPMLVSNPATNACVAIITANMVARSPLNATLLVPVSRLKNAVETCLLAFSPPPSQTLFRV